MLQRKQPDKSPKALALMVSLLLLLCVTVSGTAAFLMDNAGSIENIFRPSSVTTSVTETLTNGVKSNVKITNTGDTDAYIRAAVVATWRDAEGNLYGKAPVARLDYDITFNTVSQGKANAWIQSSEGFYYWTSSVKPNLSTDVLITEKFKVQELVCILKVIRMSNSHFQTLKKSLKQIQNLNLNLKLLQRTHFQL